MIQNFDNFLLCRTDGKQYWILISWIVVYVHVNLVPSLTSKVSKYILSMC